MARPVPLGLVLQVIGEPMVHLILKVLEASLSVLRLQRCLARVPRASRLTAIWRRWSTLRASMTIPSCCPCLLCSCLCLCLNGLSCCLNGPAVLRTWNPGNLQDRLRLRSRKGLNWRHRWSRMPCCRRAYAELADVLKGLLRRRFDRRP